MSSRYEKLDHLLAFQQKAHYEHIEHPRATIRIEPPARRSHSLHYKTKTTHEKDRQRKIQNKKMLCNLLEIYNGQGLLSKMEESSRKVSESKNKLLMRSFKKIEEQKEIKKENKDLLINIRNAEPIIGNKKDWNRHFQQHLQMEKKLCVYTGRNGPSKISFVKTFYQSKKRRLVSQENGASQRNSVQKEQKDKKLEEIADSMNRRQRRKKKSKNRRQAQTGKVDSLECCPPIQP